MTPQPSTPDEHAVTRDRLMAAAGEIFAREGYRRATIREICSLAGANIAAVNYHFGGKEELYRETFLYAKSCSSTDEEMQALVDKSVSPEDRLRRFVQAFVERVLDEGRPAWHGQLMFREMMEPTGALDGFVRDHVKPRMEALRSLVRDIAKPATLDDKSAYLCTTSIIGQMIFHHHAKQVSERLNPELAHHKRNKEILVEHISEFSIAAIKNIGRKPKEPLP